MVGDDKERTRVPVDQVIPVAGRLLSFGVDASGVDRLTVDGLNSIAHLLPKAGGRCGVYELTFADGERYVGQAVDVVARFGAHRKTWTDIVEIAFRRVPRDRLDEVERDQIRWREAAGARLRNVVYTTGRLGASDLDLLVPPSEQRRWLADHQPREIRLADRPDDPVVRRRTRHRFDRLRTDSRFSGELADLIGAYLRATMPALERTELSYWTLSALPGTNAGTYPRLFTISVHALETLYVCHDRRTPRDLQIRLNVDEAVARSQLRTRLWLSSIRAVRANYRIRPGVLGLRFASARAARDALTRAPVIKAARKLNLDLMRKGPALNWKTHCPDLVEHVLSG
ncbi:GIY-YIG nuclease family protein [Micromonospora sp. NPDC050495]|uniref:GIY-YIG nuclease family protein n=1 Tax=Micromonospora sp. NPDC050495 TaxID=3154936 RepID=UPI0033E99215